MDQNPPANDKIVSSQPAQANEPIPETPVGWLRQNAIQLLIMAAVAVSIFRWLHPLDALLGGLGIGLIIFIHELGHFVAAKLCDVHVKTFSIGFGPALPFCRFKYGETTYKLAIIPLGGYVAMVGEETGETGSEENETDAETEDAEDNDPRSFKNKPVWKRMAIISAGVIMNVLLAMVCFAIAYMHGIEEKPAILARIEPGSASWRAGLRTGSELKNLDGMENPWWDDISPEVSVCQEGETIKLETTYRGEPRKSWTIEPILAEGGMYPQLGVAPLGRLTLISIRRDPNPPYFTNSAAAEAVGSDGNGFLQGDKFIGMTDPEDPGKITKFLPNFEGLPGEYFDFRRRMIRLAGKEIKFEVERAQDGTVVQITVPPAYHHYVGLRMRMGAITAIRKGSPADLAGVLAGDRIVEVDVGEKLFSADKPPKVAGNREPIPLDPMVLPEQLDAWAAGKPKELKVKLTVLRDEGHTEQRRSFELNWDNAFRYEDNTTTAAVSPVPLNGLGLAYLVSTVVDAVEPKSPAAEAGIQPDDRILEFRFTQVDHKQKESRGSYEKIKENHWAYIDRQLHNPAVTKLEVKIEREGAEKAMTPTWDKSRPAVERGMEVSLTEETNIQKADGFLESLRMGGHRTVRMIKVTYLRLYSLVSGRTSVKMISGPITLGRISYLLAGQSIWYLILLVAMISVNLAVVNFLPIPILDGGHMVFLFYEWVRGKPAPLAVQAILTYIGLGMILVLTIFVFTMDIWRLLR